MTSGKIYQQALTAICELVKKEADITCALAASTASNLAVIAILQEKAVMFDIIMEVLQQVPDNRILGKVQVVRALKETAAGARVEPLGDLSNEFVNDLAKSLEKRGMSRDITNDLNHAVVHQIAN